jgi:hypothetical protein
MSEPPVQRRNSAPAILIIGSICLIGGLGVALLYWRGASDPVRLQAPAATTDRSVAVRASGPGATAVGLNPGTINIHNGAVPDPKGCGDGLQPYGPRCVSQSMADYISCVEASGGNKQAIVQTLTSEGKQKTAAEASGTVKGTIAEGAGKLTLGLDDEASLVGKLEGTWFPGGMSECGNALPGPLRKAALKVHRKQGAH